MIIRRWVPRIRSTPLRFASILAAVLLGAAVAPAASALHVDLESGAAFSGYNDVGIPGDTGTRFSFTDDLSTDPAAFGRLRVSYRWSDRHNLSVLIAPLRLTADGQIERPVEFAGATFPASTPLHGKYRFDSYRLTYRYDFRRGEKLRFGIGLTAKVRDAAIELSGGGIKGRKANTGPVPLLNFALEWRAHPAVVLLLDGDAAAAPQGRAEDVFAGAGFPIGDGWMIKAGYRLLEGGADNSEVYSFTAIHYAAVGLIARF